MPADIVRIATDRLAIAGPGGVLRGRVPPKGAALRSVWPYRYVDVMADTPQIEVADLRRTFALLASEGRRTAHRNRGLMM
jgi:hypothetical protein